MKRLILVLIVLFLATMTGAQAQRKVKEKEFSTTAVVNKNCKPKMSLLLNPVLHEISGLTSWNGWLFGFNDDSDTNLYAIQSDLGTIVHRFNLPKVKNEDWEEMTQDSTYFYLGDFGNNSKGNRENLHILRIEKQSLLVDAPKIDTIAFSYSNQEHFIAMSPNQTDFDCEAMIVKNDSIYLFTKQWTAEQTSVYVLPKTPGNYKASLKNTFNVEGLITGATYCADKNIIALCGYSTLLNPFVFLLYDFKEDDFFSGKKIKIAIGLPFHQIEGITSLDGLHYFLSNERFVKKPFFNTPQQLHEYDFSPFIITQNKN
jgi:hypothetical protein